jgi:hypothetical protein
VAYIPFSDIRVIGRRIPISSPHADAEGRWSDLRMSVSIGSTFGRYARALMPATVFPVVVCGECSLAPPYLQTTPKMQTGLRPRPLSGKDSLTRAIAKHQEDAG